MRVRRKKIHKEKKKGYLLSFIKSLIKDWDIKVMSYVMVIVCAVSLISGTVAWFTYFPSIRAKNMDIKLADCDNLKVSVIANGTDMDDIQVQQGEYVAISLNIPKFISGETYQTEEYVFTNYEELNPISPDVPVITTIATKEMKNASKLEPGSYGEIRFYVASLDREINYCRVTPHVLLSYNDGSEDRMDYDTWQIERINIPENGSAFSEEKIEELRNLAKGHFLVFKERNTMIEGNPEEDTTKETYVYEKQIFKDSEGNTVGALEVPLEFDVQRNYGEEKEISLYWCWPYEYTDIPQEVKENIVWNETGSRSLLPKFFFQEQERSDGTKIEFTEVLDEDILINYYDEADVNIGTYVKGIKFVLKIEGFYRNTENTTPEVPGNGEILP